MTAPPATAAPKWGLWVSGLLGVGAVGVASWVWRGKKARQPETRADQISELVESSKRVS